MVMFCQSRELLSAAVASTAEDFMARTFRFIHTKEKANSGHTLKSQQTTNLSRHRDILQEAILDWNEICFMYFVSKWDPGAEENTTHLSTPIALYVTMLHYVERVVIFHTTSLPPESKWWK